MQEEFGGKKKKNRLQLFCLTVQLMCVFTLGERVGGAYELCVAMAGNIVAMHPLPNGTEMEGMAYSSKPLALNLFLPRVNTNLFSESKRKKGKKKKKLEQLLFRRSRRSLATDATYNDDAGGSKRRKSTGK